MLDDEGDFADLTVTGNFTARLGVGYRWWMMPAQGASAGECAAAVFVGDFPEVCGDVSSGGGQMSRESFICQSNNRH